MRRCRGSPRIPGPTASPTPQRCPTHSPIHPQENQDIQVFTQTIYSNELGQCWQPHCLAVLLSLLEADDTVYESCAPRTSCSALKMVLSVSRFSSARAHTCRTPSTPIISHFAKRAPSMRLSGRDSIKSCQADGLPTSLVLVETALTSAIMSSAVRAPCTHTNAETLAERVRANRGRRGLMEPGCTDGR